MYIIFNLIGNTNNYYLTSVSLMVILLLNGIICISFTISDL